MITAKEARELLDTRVKATSHTTSEIWFTRLRISAELAIAEAIIDGCWETYLTPFATKDIVDAVVADLVKCGFDAKVETPKGILCILINWRN